MSSARSSRPSSGDGLAAALRGVLLDARAAEDLEVPGGKDAAVLVPLFVSSGEPHLVFTKRREDLKRHPGEISFPGGRRDPEDPHLEATALREACEEIGLAPEGVEMVGALQPIPTIATDYAVYPFVGLIEPGLEWTLSPREVEVVLEFSLSDLRAGFGRRRMVRRGIAFRTDTYVVGDDLIWGATARMLTDLLERFEQIGGTAQR